MERKQIDIYNISNATINNLYISAPKGTSIADVYTPSPLQLELKSDPAAENGALISVSLIQARKISRIFFRADNGDDISVINGSERGLKQVDIIFNPFVKNLASVALTAFVLSIVLFILLYYFASRDNAARIKLSEEIENKRRDDKTLIDTLIRQFENLRNDGQSSRKNNIILLARIREYAKELDFWRDTIRKVFYNLGDEKVDSILHEIVNNLKTYATLRKQDDFNYISLMALQLKNHESATEHDASLKEK